MSRQTLEPTFSLLGNALGRNLVHQYGDRSRCVVEGGVCLPQLAGFQGCLWMTQGPRLRSFSAAPGSHVPRRRRPARPQAAPMRQRSRKADCREISQDQPEHTLHGDNKLCKSAEQTSVGSASFHASSRRADACQPQYKAFGTLGQEIALATYALAIPTN